MPKTLQPPRILIRADARPELGGGHIMRCLALAGALGARGADIAFACAPGSADLVPALARSGYARLDAATASDVPMPEVWGGLADAIIVDLYTSTREDEARMRRFAPVIAVIEDLPDRAHDCDLLVDQGFGRVPADYKSRVPSGTQLLLGPDMCPLRPAFAALRQQSLARRGSGASLERVLVAMGLTDVGGISECVVELTRASLPGVAIDVVLGPLASSLAPLQQRADTDPNLSVLIDIDDMAERMMAADLAIGAGGGSSIERCVLGLPSIIIVLADNQKPAATALGRLGAALVIDRVDRPELDLPVLLGTGTPQTLLAMSQAAAAVSDGHGAGRIAAVLLDLICPARRHADPTTHTRAES